MLRLIAQAPNIGDKVFDSKGLFLRVGITFKIYNMELL